MNQPRRSWRRVSLRTLLVLMLGCGCVLGLIGRESQQARRRAEVVEDLRKAASSIAVEHVNIFGGSAEKLAEFERKGSLLVGDVHPLEIDAASAYTPVPGGVGPLTIAMLMSNTVAAAERRL